MLFGTGLSIPANVVNLRLEYRYSMGFVDLKLPKGPGAPEVELRNASYSLTFGLVF